MLKNDGVSGVAGATGVVGGYNVSPGWITGPKGLTGNSGGCPVGVQGVAGTSGWVLMCDHKNCTNNNAKTYIIEDEKHNFCTEHKIEFDKNMRKQKLNKIKKII